MGEVFLAHDLATGREVALKKLRAQADPTAAATLRAEFEALKRFQHPALVQVHDFGFGPGGEPYFTMDYVPGLAADRVVARGDWRALGVVAERVAEALEALHAQGLAHGDLKPSNILVVHGQEVPQRIASVYLVDFGLVRRLADPGGGHRGTPGYAAPEIVLGGPPSIASDLYSLGVTMFALIAQRLPFESADSDEVLRLQQLGPPSSLPLESAGAPWPLIELVLRLLAPRPVDRPRDAGEVRKDLERWLPAIRRPLAERLLSRTVVGRERELASLEQWIVEPAVRSAAKIVAGPAGCGKSALLGELGSRASLADRAVLSLSAANLDGPAGLAHAVVRALTRGDGRGRGAKSGGRGRRRARSENSANDDLAALVERTVTAATTLPDAGGGLLVLVDDADHLDEASAAWLRRVLLHPVAVPIRWVLAVRTLDGVANEAIRLLADAGLAHAQRLEWLRRTDVTRLIGQRLLAPVPAALDKFVWDRASGHPGLSAELLHAAAACGALRESEAGLVFVPESLTSIAPIDFEAALLSRARQLDETAQSVVALLAVARVALPVDRLTAWIPALESRTIETLVDSGLVSHESDDRLVFRAPSLAARLLESLAAPERAALHRRLLELPGLPAADRFHHLQAAGLEEDALSEAARAWEQHADRGIALAAATIAEGAHAVVAAAMWFERAAFACTSEGRYADAIPMLERALELDAEPARRGDRWLLLSTAVLRARAPQEVIGVIRRTEGEPLSNTHRIQLRINCAASLMALGSSDDAEREAREALAAADLEGDPLGAALASEILALIGSNSGRLEEASRHIERARTESARCGRPVVVARILGQAAGLERMSGRFDEAERILRHAVEGARGLGNRHALHSLLGQLTAFLTSLGRWSELQAPARESVRIAIEDGRASDAAYSYLLLATVEGLTGNSRAAARLGRVAVRLSQRSCPSILSGAWRAVAIAARVRGHWARAEKALHRALRHSAAGSLEEAWWARIELGLVHAARKRWAEAGQAWESVWAEGQGHRGIAWATATALAGRAALRSSTAERAAQRLDEVEAWLVTQPVAYPLGYARALKAEMALVRGELTEAFEAGAQALGALDNLPAPADHARVALELARLAPETDAAHSHVLQWLEEAQHTCARTGDRATLLQVHALQIKLLHRGAPAPSPTRDRELLERVSWLFHSLGDLDELMNRAMKSVVEQLGAERGVLLLRDESNGQLLPMAEVGTVDSDLRIRAVGFSRRLVQRVTDSGDSLVIEDAAQDPRARTESVLDLRLRSILCVPLVVGTRVIGAIYLHDSRRPSSFGEAERVMVEGFAQVMAAAIERSRRLDELRLESEALASENLSLRRQIGAQGKWEGVIGTSQAMRQVLTIVEHAARTNATVLMTGENGTGKDLIARTLHRLSKRNAGPFVVVNCGALPESLLESELYGIRANVATGVRARPGRFLQANGGTLFLDEIGDMPIEQQVALLSAISNREITPVGGGKPIPLDVRIIAATNRNLRQLVESGKFREDLYYRVSVIEIEVPPLRERKADVPALARHFLQKSARENSRAVPPLAPDFLTTLSGCEWPGNVRELENYIERVFAMMTGEVLRAVPPPRSLGRRIRMPRPPGVGLRESVWQLERTMLTEALQEARGNQSLAARRLGIPEQKVRQLMKKYGLPSHRRRPRLR
ncbi:MAG: sigma 54-interacting transcriptional regulator [Candidatus Eisenbacteria bacterium]|uniref:Sigma 54-interacting transcriptional regulator n=1 Tax=Eiseniibacteriota bacterium TaxID=2212470 RepID=A0A849SJL3_UNCEI|nr:sigma 54-interacting transcriptional regulator [Candidatus Eisenbacteria bacterium]